MRDYLLVGFVLAALPFVLKRPDLGILLWCVFSYMNPHRYTYGLAYDFPFAAVIGGTTLVALVFSRDPKRIPWSGLTAVWVMFVFWISFTTLFAMISGDAYVEWVRSMKIQLMTFATLLAINTRERLQALIWVIVLSIGFYGIKGGLFTIATSGEQMVFGPPDSFIAGNNSLGLALVMMFPLMRYLQLNTQSRWLRFGLAAMMALSAFAILASYSRGAFLAIAAMGTFLLLKSRKKVIVILAALILVPTVLTFMPDKYFERLETIKTYDADASALGRINAWWFAYNIAVERPIVGGGYGVFDRGLFLRYAPDPADFHGPHSIYFEVLGEHGFIGLMLFLSLGWLMVRKCGAVVRHARDHPELGWARDLGAMLQVSVIGYAVGGAFLGLAYFDLYYHLIAIALIASTLVEKTLAGEKVEAPAPMPSLKAAGSGGA